MRAANRNRNNSSSSSNNNKMSPNSRNSRNPVNRTHLRLMLIHLFSQFEQFASSSARLARRHGPETHLGYRRSGQLATVTKTFQTTLRQLVEHLPESTKEACQDTGARRERTMPPHRALCV